MKYNKMSGRLSRKSLRRSPSSRQRIARKRVIDPYAREIRVRGSV